MASKEGKSAKSSMTIWGGLLALGTGAFEIGTELNNSGLLPTHWTPYLASVGGFLAILGRLKAKLPIIRF